MIDQREVREATAVVPTDDGRKALVAPLVCGVAACALLLVATMFPLWQATLQAPQYPGGLRMIAYGNRVTGDIREINMLNHYIGMKPFSWADIPERALWIPSLLAAAVAVMIALVVRNKWVKGAALAALWFLPIGVLADVQFRLYQCGHDLDPKAALRIPEFTPWVVGPTKVWNFTTLALPGPGLLLLLLAAALVTFGPRLIHRINLRSLGATGGAALLLVAVLAPPADASPEMRSLQAIVEGARVGDRIVLDPITYHGSVTVDKPLTIIGEGAVLHGDGSGSVLTIASDDVRVEGLTIRHSAPGPLGSPAGVRVRGERIVLRGLAIADSYVGISVQRSRDVSIESSAITGRGGTSLGNADHALEASESHGSYGRDDMPEAAVTASPSRTRVP